VAQYLQAKRRRVKQEASVAEQEAPLAEEEHFGWSSNNGECERN
jgi:hypothetical protein